MCFVRSKRAPIGIHYPQHLSRFERYQIPDDVLSQEEKLLVHETMSACRSGDINAIRMLRDRVVSEVDIACLKSKVRLFIMNDFSLI